MSGIWFGDEYLEDAQKELPKGTCPVIKQTCGWHIWKTYTGLHEVFEYCEKCNITRKEYEQFLKSKPI
jgi:benzoyl-CoA reductase/2-hydroxyglutaryl-CoA dehydratase subunit BcrC/BadD/HgdB